MDLKENRIRVHEILANPSAEALLRREFPSFMNPMMLRAGKNMTLQQVLSLAGGRFPRERIMRILRELEAL